MHLCAIIYLKTLRIALEITLGTASIWKVRPDGDIIPKLKTNLGW
jgi:hypothetical protein